MTKRPTFSTSEDSPDQVSLRADLDRSAEERSENEGFAEHRQKADDPKVWENERSDRTSEPGAVAPAQFAATLRWIPSIPQALMTGIIVIGLYFMAVALWSVN